MTLVLRADTIGKSFGRQAVLRAATLRATAGQVVYLVGRNGCGKTTLLRIAAGVIPADHGEVTYIGEALLRPRWHAMARRGFCYLPDRELLSPVRTVRWHLQAIVRQFRLPGYDAAVEACVLAPLLDERCGALSSGERRRVEVATAVARGPSCLLADEPYRNIDPADRTIIAHALRALAATGCAVVVTGHEIEELFAMADSLAWCTDGTTYELGSPAEALTHWRFVQEYVGPARAAQMAASAGPRIH